MLKNLIINVKRLKRRGKKNLPPNDGIIVILALFTCVGHHSHCIICCIDVRKGKKETYFVVTYLELVPCHCHPSLSSSVVVVVGGGHWSCWWWWRM